MENKQITVTINGLVKNANIAVGKTLLEFLRQDCQLTGTKEGCAVGECGACTVLVDDMTVDACIYLAVWADGRRITTIEGIAGADGSLSNLQRNFIECGAVQCGFCTPGLVVAATALLNNNPEPTEQEIKRGLAGNLCRCTGYQKIIEAVKMSAL